MQLPLVVTIDSGGIAAFVGILMGTLVVTYIANKIVNWILLMIFKHISPTARAFSSAIVVAFLCVSTTFTDSRLFWAYLVSVSVWLIKDLKRPDLMKW